MDALEVEKNLFPSPDRITIPWSSSPQPSHSTDSTITAPQTFRGKQCITMERLKFTTL